MAKRHHQSRRARYHEHAGEERHLHGYHKGHGHHLSHAEAEKMVHDKMRHEHGRHHMIRHKYDTLMHEKDMFNDETHHDRMSEASGPYHYDRQEPGAGKYEGYKGRRHQEMMDSGMIHENPREIANLPQEVMIKPYGNSYGYTPEDLNDTIVGIDRQIGYDDSQKMRHFFPKKV